MAEQIDAPTITLTSAEALAQHRLVRADGSGDAVYCDAGEYPLGAVADLVATSTPTAIKLLNKQGTIKLMASGVIAINAPCYTAADGKISATNVGVRVGYAREAAAADTDIIQVYPDLARVGVTMISPPATIGQSSTAEAAFASTVPIPAADLVVGSRLRITVGGLVVGADTTPTLTIKVKVGTELVASAVNANIAPNDIFQCWVDVIIRTLGASGTIVSHATVHADVAGAATLFPYASGGVEDISATATVSVTAQFDASHANNEVRLDILNVEHIRP